MNVKEFCIQNICLVGHMGHLGTRKLIIIKKVPFLQATNAGGEDIRHGNTKAITNDKVRCD